MEKETYIMKNLQYMIDNFSNSMDIITGDGGFDFSADFNKQESTLINIYQVIYALIMQKKNGHFVLKLFDILKIVLLIYYIY